MSHTMMTRVMFTAVGLGQLVNNPLILDRCISQLSDSVRSGNCVHLYNVCCMHMCLLRSLFWALQIQEKKL